MEVNQTRINKFLSECGYCSRREADKLLEEGRITINGIVPEMGTKVTPDDEVRVDGKLVREKEKNQFIWPLTNLLELNVLRIKMLETILWITSIIRNAFSRLADWTKPVKD